MLNKIFRETEYALHVIKEGIGVFEVGQDIYVVAKYLKVICNYKPKKIKEFLRSIKMFNNDDEFEQYYIDNAMKRLRNKEEKMINIESVDIFEEEIKYIETMQFDNDVKKVALTLLFFDKLHKIKNKIYGNESKEISAIGSHYEDLCIKKSSNIAKSSEFYKILHSLYKAKYISIPKSWKVIYKIIPVFIKQVPPGSKVAFTIHDFDNIGRYYTKYQKNNVTYCSKCNQLIEKKSNKTKYCKKCFKEQRKEKVKQNVRNFRNTKCNQIETPLK